MTELEQNLSQMVAEREKQIEIDAEHIRALQKQNGELTDKVRELEEENAELKEQCLILANCNTCTSACKTENIEMKKKLTKAKEIINEFNEVYKDNLDYCYHIEEQLTEAKGLLKRWLRLYNTNTVKGIIADTEKFIKE